MLRNILLYGLKQAARTWYELLIFTLKGMGFEQCSSDPCVLRLIDDKTRNVRVVFAIHIDDMVVRSSEQDCDWLKSTLSETFPVNHLVPLK